ncbi:MAG: hypothetical protein IKT41_00285 [Clostridia bacterium]|nr:hypothetical protein [Clostridia bacterium]
MKKIKICLEDNYISTCKSEKFNMFIQSLYNENILIDCHIHYIDNKEKYDKWLLNRPRMPWKTIINLITINSEDEVLNKFKLNYHNIYDLADIYVMDIIEYSSPVNNSELITSVYKWNYNNNKEIRDKYMTEHFEMEQKQVYYKYVTFNLVTKNIKNKNRNFDFFFESHVSDKNGIDEIYSKPALDNMRKHSEQFLNTETRLLSFGEIFIIRRK